MSPHSSNNILHEIAQAISTASGDEFFRSLTAALCQTLEMDFAFIGRLDADQPGVIQVIGVCIRDKIAENFSYRLHGTPCENVVGSEPCHYPHNIQDLFPEDRMLVEMGVESYIGYPLFDSAGQALGLLTVMHSGPLPEEEPAISVLRLCASRAAAELERHRSDRLLRESEERFRQMAESIQEVFWMTDPAKNRMLYVSPAYEEIWGRSCQSLYDNPRTWLDAIHHDDRERVLHAALSKQMLGEYNEEYRIVRPDGIVRWIWDRAFPIRDSAGNVYRVTGIAEDITGRVLAENENRRMQAFLNSVIENLPNMMFVKGAKDLRFVRFNKAAEELLGYPREEMLGKNDRDFFPKEEADFFTAQDRAVLDSGRLRDIPEEPIHTRHKGVRFLHTQKIPILDEAGQPLYLLGISEDITERKATEDKLARLGRILDNSSNEIYIFDADTLRFMQVNRGGSGISATPWKS